MQWGRFGFSFIGLLYLCMLTVPNLMWLKRQPGGYTAAGENRLLSVCEKAGQACVTCSALIFSYFEILPLSPRSLWLAASFVLMLMYEGWWVRYFRSKRTLRDFYSSFLGVPVAGATLPVTAFFLLGVYARALVLMLSVLVLGIGHIGIHIGHLRGMKE